MDVITTEILWTAIHVVEHPSAGILTAHLLPFVTTFSRALDGFVLAKTLNGFALGLCRVGTESLRLQASLRGHSSGGSAKGNYCRSFYLFTPQNKYFSRL